MHDGYGDAYPSRTRGFDHASHTVVDIRMNTTRTAAALLACALPGCSFLYGTSELVTLDAAPDSEIVDVDPLDPMLERVETSGLLEGQGSGGSRPAILLVHGANLTGPSTTVALASSGDATPAQPPLVDNAALVADRAGHLLAVPVSFDVDPGVGAGQTMIFDLTLTHDEGGTIVSRTLPGAVQVMGLDELTVAPADGLAGGTRLFSAIAVTSGTLVAKPNQAEPIRLRSMSSVSIAAPISVAAGAPPAAGPAGGVGGAGGQGGLVNTDPGASGGGPEPGTTNGEPAGFIGDDVLSTLSGTNRSSGGAGGNGKDITSGGVTGGAGGGGGGTIELVADGDLAVADIAAGGAAGAAPENGNAGGAGSGGMIVLVSPSVMLGTSAAIFANGGHGGGGSDNSTAGFAGTDPTGPASGGSGGIGSGGAGDGGPGFPAGNRDGEAGTGNDGGGGGGGGAGIIRVYGTTLSGPKISPQPS